MNLNVYQFDAKFMDWNESIPDTREITNASDQSNLFWYMKLKVQFISVFIYVQNEFGISLRKKCQKI